MLGNVEARQVSQARDGRGSTVTLPPGTPEVIPALLGLLGQTRKACDVEPEEIVRRLPFPVNASEVERWEWGESWPSARRLDEIVAVYATVTDSVVSELWGEALVRGIMLQGDLGMLDEESPPLG
jgi:hypothetical protein